jgi:hypothetical protein
MNQDFSPDTASFRHADPDQLAAALSDARHYTLTLFDSLAAAGYDQAHRVPRLSILNPPLWELGHIAWFAEWFVLREAISSHPADAQAPGLLARGDDWFDSNLVAHRSRWTLDLPGPGAIKTYCREVNDRILDRLAREPGEGPGLDAALYAYRLALAHEDMHGEAFLYTMQTLGVAPQPTLADRLAQAHMQAARASGRPRSASPAAASSAAGIHRAASCSTTRSRAAGAAWRPSPSTRSWSPTPSTWSSWRTVAISARSTGARPGAPG